MSAAPAWRRPDPRPIHLHPVTVDAGAQLSRILISWRMWQESANLSERTIKERANTITMLLAFSGCGPLELTPERIMAYTTRPGISRTTRATYHTSIHAYTRWLVVTGQRDDDPILRTPKPKRPKGAPRPITPAQLADLLTTVNRSRTRMMILLAAFAGLRVHEIAKIRGEDIDWDSGVLYVTGKGDKTAVLPLHRTVLEHAAGKFPRRGYWFPSWRNPGRPISGQAVSMAIRQNMKRAGIDATPHALRHTFATTMVRNGVDLRTVQELLRHSSLATTAIYTQVSDEQRRTAIDGLHLEERQL